MPSRDDLAYLSPDEKAREMASLLGDIARAHEGETGRGSFDWPMLPWLARLNRIADVCTLQSCTGHRHADGGLDSGTIWIRLSERAMRRCEPDLGSLARLPRIERVRIEYLPDRSVSEDGSVLKDDGTDTILETIFTGLGQHDSLEGALEGVCGWLEERLC